MPIQLFENKEKRTLGFPPVYTFQIMYQQVRNNDVLTSLLRSYGDMQICWALALINAWGLLHYKEGNEKLLAAQNAVLIKLLRIGSTNWTQNEFFRQEVLRKGWGVPVDASSGGFISGYITPLPSPALNAQLAASFQMQLRLKMNWLTKDFRSCLLGCPLGAPYLMAMTVLERGRTTPHLAIFARVDDKSVFIYDPAIETPEPIGVGIGGFVEGCRLYTVCDSDEGTVEQYYHRYGTLPLEVVAC